MAPSQLPGSHIRTQEQQSYDPNSNNYPTTRDSRANKRYDTELARRCRDHLISVRLSIEENPATAESFRGVDWLKEESPWPSDAQRRVHRYMHDNNLYQVTNTNDRVFENLVDLVKSQAVVPNTRNWQQKVPDKCRALIYSSAEAWKQDGLLITHNNVTSKSEVFQDFWDCAIQAARVSFQAAQSIERGFQRDEPGTASPIAVDSMSGTRWTPEDSNFRKRSAGSMQQSQPPTPAKRAFTRQSDIPKDHETDFMDIGPSFSSVASPARGLVDENTRHAIAVSNTATSQDIYHGDTSVPERSVNRFDSTVMTAREALSALDPAENGRWSLQEGIHFSQEKIHQDFATESHGDPTSASSSNHDKYLNKAKDRSPTYSKPSPSQSAAIAEGLNQPASRTPIAGTNTNQRDSYSRENLPSVRQITSWEGIDRHLSPIGRDGRVISSSMPNEMENSIRNSSPLSRNINFPPESAPKASQAERRDYSLTAQAPAEAFQTLSSPNHQSSSADSGQSNPASQPGDSDVIFISEKRYSLTPSEESGISELSNEFIGPPQKVTKHQNMSQNSGNGQLASDTRSSQFFEMTKVIAQRSSPAGITDKDRDIESTKLVSSDPPVIKSAHEVSVRPPGPSSNLLNVQSLLPEDNQIRHIPYSHFSPAPPAAPPSQYQRPASTPIIKEQQMSPGLPPPYSQNRPPPSHLNQESAPIPLSSRYQNQPSPTVHLMTSNQNQGPALPPIATQAQRLSGPWKPPPPSDFSPQYQKPSSGTSCQAPLPSYSVRDLKQPSSQPGSTKQLPPPTAPAQGLGKSFIRPVSNQQHYSLPPPPPAQYHDPPHSPAQGQGSQSSSASIQYQSPYPVDSSSAAPGPVLPQPSSNPFQGSSSPVKWPVQPSPYPPLYEGPALGTPPAKSTYHHPSKLPPPSPNFPTQWQGPQHPHQYSQHVPGLDQKQASSPPLNASQHAGQPPYSPSLNIPNQPVSATSDSSLSSAGAAFPDQQSVLWKKFNEMISVIVPVRQQTNANTKKSGLTLYSVSPAGSVLTQTVANIFQWFHSVSSTVPPPALSLDFINIRLQSERRMIIYREDSKSLEAVKNIAWEYFMDIAALDPAVVNVKILITPCYSVVSDSVCEPTHQQSQHLHGANNTSNIPSDQPSYLPLPNQNGFNIPSDSAAGPDICKTGPPAIGLPPKRQSSLSRTSAPDAMVSHTGSSNLAPLSTPNLNNTNAPEGNNSEFNDTMVEAPLRSIQAPQHKSQQQASLHHTPNRTRIDKINPSTAKIVIRIQIDGLGRLSRSYDKSVLNAKITNERFFQWFQQETGGPNSPKLKFDFKDALPAKSSIIERGNEDHFELMVHDIKRKFDRAKVFSPDMNEFCIVVTDPMWKSGDEDGDEDEDD